MDDDSDFNHAKYEDSCIDILRGAVTVLIVLCLRVFR